MCFSLKHLKIREKEKKKRKEKRETKKEAIKKLIHCVFLIEIS